MTSTLDRPNINPNRPRWDRKTFLEDYRFMLETGEHPERIAARLGLGLPGHHKRLHELGEPLPRADKVT